MYDPKGGDKPAYDPPSEPQPYAKPPVDPPPYPTPPPGDPYQKPPGDQPPYQKPPEGQQPPYQKPPGEQPPYEKPPSGEQPPYQKPPEQPPYQKPPVEQPPEKPPGGCQCQDWPIQPCPADTEPFRRLLLRLEEVVEALAKANPSDATKKFPDDLKDADKEYQGVIALVSKYKEFYDKLDCSLADANRWKEDIDNCLIGKLTDAEKAGIENSRKTNYDDKEKTICCQWITRREELNGMVDCLEQAKTKEEEAKDNYEGIKGLEKTLTDRFAELKTLYGKVKPLCDEERFKAVYAVSLEYAEVFASLSLIRDWTYARTQCGIAVTDSTSCPTSPSTPVTGDLKKDWTPDKFKAEVVRRLRLLILAKFQRFRWQHQFLTKASESKEKKEACEKFRKDRREQFIQEADDTPAAESTQPGGGVTQPGYGEQPPPPPGYPPGQTPPYPTPPPQPPPTPYAGGQKPEYTPPPPPPPDQYQGQKPGYTPPPPPPDQYQGGKKPEYPAEPPAPPTDKYRGRSKG